MAEDDDSGIKVEGRKMIFKNAIDFLIAPTVYSLKIKANATPNVSNIKILLPQSVANTITNFIGGSENQELNILGDGVLVIANNANIHTNTGANKVQTAGKMYTYFCVGNIWYEHA